MNGVVKIVARSYDLSCYPRVHISVLLIDGFKKKERRGPDLQSNIGGVGFDFTMVHVSDTFPVGFSTCSYSSTVLL